MFRLFTSGLLFSGLCLAQSPIGSLNVGNTLPASCSIVRGDVYQLYSTTSGTVTTYTCNPNLYPVWVPTSIASVSSVGSGITQLTADVTAGPGSGSQVATLATVNSGPGTCGDSTHICQVTTNGKGLITSQTAVGISGGVRALWNPSGVLVKGQAGVPGAGVSWGTSSAPTAVLDATDGIQGYLQFAASTTAYFYDTLQLPADWAGTLKVVVSGWSTSTSAPTLSFAYVCDSTANPSNPTFGTATSISFTPASSSGRTRVSTTITMSGCSAGNALYFKFTGAGSSGAAFNLISMVITE